jgi:hypothetical protein
MPQIDKFCTVHQAGYNANGETVLELEAQDNTFGKTWFTSDPDPARAFLAVALAAITTGKMASCVVDDPTAGADRGIMAILLVA